MAHWLALLSATSASNLWLDLLKYLHSEDWIKAYVKLFHKTPQTEHKPLGTTQLHLKFLDKHGSIVSHFLMGQLNQTLLDRKQTLFPVFNLCGGEQVTKYPYIMDE